MAITFPNRNPSAFCYENETEPEPETEPKTEPKSKDLDMDSIQQPMDLGMGNLLVSKFGIVNSKRLLMVRK